MIASTALKFMLGLIGFFGSLLTFGWLFRNVINDFSKLQWKKLKPWQQILIVSACLLALMCALELIYKFSNKLTF